MSMFRRMLMLKQQGNFIRFEGLEVERICIAKFDKDGDGKVSKEEIESVTNISTYFADNPNLVNLKDLRFFIGLKVLEQQSLRNDRALVEVWFPKSLQVVGAWSFMNVRNLKKVVFLSVTPPTLQGNTVFYHNTNYNYPPDMLIYVPDESVDAYKGAWKEYKEDNNDKLISRIRPMSEYKE